MPCPRSRRRPASPTSSSSGAARSASTSIGSDIACRLRRRCGGFVHEPDEMVTAAAARREDRHPAGRARRRRASRCRQRSRRRSSARAIAGSVKVRRGCGWSSSPAVTTNRSDSSSVGDPGKSDAVCPSGPSPRCTSAIGAADRTQLVVRGRPCFGRRAGPVHPVDRAGLDLVEERDARHALVRVRVVHGDPTLVAEEHVDGVPRRRRRSPAARSTAGPSRRRRVRSTRAPSRRRAPRTPAERCRLFAPLRAPGDDTAMDRATVEVYEEGAARWRDTRPARFIELAEVIGRQVAGRNPARRPRVRGRAAPAGARRPGRRARRGVRDGRARRATSRRTRGRSRGISSTCRSGAARRWLVGARELPPRPADAPPVVADGAPRVARGRCAGGVRLPTR